jgi:DNA-binding winged helix-turn-helix (wHTH) protein/TolB-like protein
MESRESTAVYRFGDFVLDTRAFRVSRDGLPVHLEPKAVDVLRYLLERAGLLVSKHELIRAVWKDTAVTDNALTRVIAQLRRALEDPVDQPRYIETIPTRGYRFIAQPAVAADDGCAHGVAAPLAVPPRPRVSPIALAVAAVVLIASVAAVLTVARRIGQVGAVVSSAAVSVDPIRSVAVLPLKNLSGNPEQDYLAEGITQALSDTLSRLRVLTVVSTTSSTRYRNTALTASAIARELRVDGLIEGAVVRSGSQLRITIAIVDGPSGRRIWSNAYDRAMADVLTMYEEIASRMAGGIKVAVDASNASRAGRRSVDPEAYDEYLRGMYLLGNRWMAGGCRDAERLLLHATDLDPDFAPAYAALAWCYAYPDRLGRDIADIGQKARTAVTRALSLDDRLPLAHAVAGTI